MTNVTTYHKTEGETVTEHSTLLEACKKVISDLKRGAYLSIVTDGINNYRFMDLEMAESWTASYVGK